MTPLRQKMLGNLRLRNLAPTTSKAYVQCVSVFARHFGRSPDTLGTEEVRAFLLHLDSIGRAPATRVIYHAALCFLYSDTLGRPEVMATVPRPRVCTPPPRPSLSKPDVRALLRASAHDPFLYTFVATLLATGLRLAEASNLQTSDIDSRAMLIHVRRGKGAKPRSVRLGDKHLRLLRRYWRAEGIAGRWLFPAQRIVMPGLIDPVLRWADHPVNPNTIRGRIHSASARAGLRRRVTPHDLRRTYATWLLEADVDLRTVQELLGHATPKTTARYTQVRPELIRRTPSPYEML